MSKNYEYREYIQPVIEKPHHGVFRYVNLYLYHRVFNRGSINTKIVKEIIWEEIEEESCAPIGMDSPVRLQDEEAQLLADQLWDAGYRPSGAKGSHGQLDAINNHLQDMKKIAFFNLNLEDG